MFACFASENKKTRKSKPTNENSEDDKENHNKLGEESNNNSLSEIEKQEQNLSKLKRKLNEEYRNFTHINKINDYKLNLYNQLIEEYNNLLENDPENATEFKEYINSRNNIVSKEIKKMKNENSTLKTEFNALFDEVSKISDNRYSKVPKLEDDIFILENKIKAQQNKLIFLEKRYKFFCETKNLEQDYTQEIFLELYDPDNKKTESFFSDINSSDSSNSSSSSEEDSKNIKSVNSMEVNVGQPRIVNKKKLFSKIPRECIDAKKNIIKTIIEENLKNENLKYQTVFAKTQEQLRLKAKNTNILNDIKNEIKNFEDPNYKKTLESEKSVKKSEEDEKKKLYKEQKQLYYKKDEELDALEKELKNLQNELISEEEEYKQIEDVYQRNNKELETKIKEGNDIEIELENLKKQRDTLLLELLGNKSGNIVKDDKNIENENNGNGDEEDKGDVNSYQIIRERDSDDQDEDKKDGD